MLIFDNKERININYISLFIIKFINIELIIT